MMTSAPLSVTEEQVAAAQLRLVLDEKLGRETPEVVRQIAAMTAVVPVKGERASPPASPSMAEGGTSTKLSKQQDAPQRLLAVEVKHIPPWMARQTPEADPGGYLLDWLSHQPLTTRWEWFKPPTHPETLTSRAYLASRLGEIGDPTSASAVFEQVLNDQLRVLGPDHPETLATRAKLAYWREKVEASERNLDDP